ncbi:MDGA2 protein, partial [Agelaius phoeniceus]|nr:MDGA2 protein [Agelaius phoeniceus]NXV69871.1 MDGA2 protein [Molothrus ater]
MYIETSRPRLEGEKARLVSPVFSVAPKNPYGATNTAYCFSFYYHMYGQHIGERKPIPLGKIAGKNSSCLKENHGKSASSSESLA